MNHQRKCGSLNSQWVYLFGLSIFAIFSWLGRTQFLSYWLWHGSYGFVVVFWSHHFATWTLCSGTFLFKRSCTPCSQGRWWVDCLFLIIWVCHHFQLLGCGSWWLEFTFWYWILVNYSKFNGQNIINIPFLLLMRGCMSAYWDHFTPFLVQEVAVRLELIANFCKL